MAWTIDSGKLLTDMGDYAFKDGFIYIEDITTDQTETVVTAPNKSIQREKVDFSDTFNTPHSDKVTIKDELKPWRNNPSKANKSRRVYLKGQESRGYFELVKDLEDNYYSVHFKPADKENPNAFSKEEKQVLFQALADMIPDGAYVSTWGELSKGGVSGLNRFAELGFIKTGERDVATKAGEPLKIPIFKNSQFRQIKSH